MFHRIQLRDTRESPALDIIELLEQKGSKVSYHDPLVPVLDFSGKLYKSTPLEGVLLDRHDCVVIVADHSQFDWEYIAKHSRLVFDTRNATAEIRNRYSNIAVL